MPITVDDYMDGLKGTPAEVARELRKMILKMGPQLEESMKWNQPVYAYGGPVCYFRAGARHVTFGFWRGGTLRKHNDRLESGGEKMAHLKLRTLDDLDRSEIKALLHKAIELNEKRGDPLLEIRKE